MDLYSAPWLHHQQQPQQHTPESSHAQHAHHEGRPASADDWKDRTTPSGQTGGAGSPSAQPGMDLSDFGLGDMPGELTFE